MQSGKAQVQEVGNNTAKDEKNKSERPAGE